MKARTAEVARIKSPIKKELKHLGGQSQQKFPELLNEIVSRLLNEDYKLIQVSKSYRENGYICSDNYWKREEKVENIIIVWMCKVQLMFDNGFKFRFDFDYWFKFSKMIQNIKGDLYQSGFPFTDRQYAKKFGEKEAEKIMERTEESLKNKIREKVSGWGEHSFPDKVSEKRATAICHRKEFDISSISQMGKLRRNLIEIREEPIDLVKKNHKDYEEKGQKKLKELYPFEINPDSIEGYLAYFLWFRNPGGGFEFQLYRFIHENFDNSVEKKEIRNALLRLEVHGYANVKKTPEKIVKKFRKHGIKRSDRFYETGEFEIPGRILDRRLNKKVRVKAYLSPLPKKRLINHLNAPDYKINNLIEKLVRKNYLKKRKTSDFLGRTVNKLKTIKSPRNLKGLEHKIMKKVKKFYNVQKNSLDQVQKARPQY